MFPTWSAAHATLLFLFNDILGVPPKHRAPFSSCPFKDAWYPVVWLYHNLFSSSSFVLTHSVVMKSLSVSLLALTLVYLWSKFLEVGLLGHRIICNYVICRILPNLRGVFLNRMIRVALNMMVRSEQSYRVSLVGYRVTKVMELAK